MTAALHHCQSSFFADFVCFLDADEFIAAKDRASFEASMAIVPVGAASLHSWQTFLPDPMGGSATDPLANLTYQRIKEQPQYFKSFLRLGGAHDTSIGVVQGNHGFTTSGGRKIPSVHVADVALRHLPLRSAEQLLTKGVVSWLANIARFPNDKKKRMAYQWKRIFDLAGRPDQPISAQMLADEAMAYAQDAPNATFAANAMRQSHGINLNRLYSSGKSADHFQTVALSIIRAHQPAKIFSPPLRPAYVRDKTKGVAHPDIANAFEDNWHWQNLFLDVAPFRYVTEKYAPFSAIDIGCGNGLCLHLLQSAGVKDILGIDGIDLSATVLNENTYAKVDLQIPYNAGRRFDAVFCLEVVEHVHPKDTDVMFDTIAAHAKDLIVFSMAEPGQPGNGHINCRTIQQILDLWKDRCFVPDLIETLGLRALSTTSWFRRNILVLKPIGADHTDAASKVLRQISAMNYIWYAQSPGIRQAAFQERFPSAKRGYGKVIV